VIFASQGTNAKHHPLLTYNFQEGVYDVGLAGEIVGESLGPLQLSTTGSCMVG